MWGRRRGAGEREGYNEWREGERGEVGGVREEMVVLFQTSSYLMHPTSHYPARDCELHAAGGHACHNRGEDNKGSKEAGSVRVWLCYGLLCGGRRGGASEHLYHHRQHGP